MAYTSVFNNIIFIEGGHPSAQNKKELKIRKGGIGAQLKNLDNIKDALASQAKAAGCNAVIDFKYGQKSRLFAIDDVAFFGSGTAAMLPDDVYNELLTKHSN
jgi:hypothetical protein